MDGPSTISFQKEEKVIRPHRNPNRFHPVVSFTGDIFLRRIFKRRLIGLLYLTEHASKCYRSGQLVMGTCRILLNLRFFWRSATNRRKPYGSTLENPSPGKTKVQYHCKGQVNEEVHTQCKQKISGQGAGPWLFQFLRDEAARPEGH